MRACPRRRARLTAGLGCRDHTAGGGSALSCALRPAGRQQGVPVLLSHRFPNPVCSPGEWVSKAFAPLPHSGPARPSDLGERPPGAERWGLVSQDPKPNSHRGKQEKPEKQQHEEGLRVTPRLPCFHFPRRGLVALSPGHVFAQWTLQTHPREDAIEPA